MTSSLNGGSARSYDRMKYEYDVSIILYRMCYKHNTQEIDNRLFKLTYILTKGLRPANTLS